MLEQMNLAALMPMIDEVIAAGGVFRLYPRGISMLPMLVEGEDSVELVAAEPYAVGDVLLYRRENGYYVLHRVFKAGPESLTMIGDAQTVLEPGIQPEQVIAIVTRVERKGKQLAPGSFWWEFFEKGWIRIIPLRRLIQRVYGGIKRS